MTPYDTYIDSLLPYVRWKMDANVGGVVQDVYNPGSHDLSLSGTNPTFGQASYHANLGTAVLLDGVDDLFTLPSDMAMAGGTGFSCVFWHKDNGSTSSNERVIRIIDANNQTSLVLYKNYNGVVGQIYASLRLNPGGAGHEATFTTVGAMPNTGTWRKYAFVAERGQAGKLYRGGALLDSQGAFAAGDTSWGIGGSVGGLNPHLKGTIDDIAIWNRALTAGEVANLWTKSTEADVVNTAPVVATPSITTAPITAETTTISATCASITDAEGNPCAVAWKLYKDGALVETVNQGAAATPIVDRTVDFSAYGAIAKGDPMTVTATADDGAGGVTTSATSAAVVVANTGLSIAPIADATVYENRTNVAITAVATDVDGGADVASFSAPNLATEAPNFENPPTFSALRPSGNSCECDITLKAGISDAGQGPVAGVYPITIRATDVSGAFIETVVNVTVANNPPVVAAVGSQVAQKGTTVEFLLSGTDENGQDVNFRTTAEQLAVALNGTPIATPAWVTAVQLTPTTGKLVVAIPAGTGDDVYTFELRGKDA